VSRWVFGATARSMSGPQQTGAGPMTLRHVCLRLGVLLATVAVGVLGLAWAPSALAAIPGTLYASATGTGNTCTKEHPAPSLLP
jgi:hypothetical protein